VTRHHKVTELKENLFYGDIFYAKFA